MNREELELRIGERLTKIYDDKSAGSSITRKLIDVIEETKSERTKPATPWSEKDIILITYGDSIQQGGEKPLTTLKIFLDKFLNNSISHVHILPFFPYSSDDGFSVIDYYQVDPNLGDWENIASLTENYELMADLVINHISQHSKWFQNYLKGLDPGADYFIESDPEQDLSLVVRPRSLPLLTPAQTNEGLKHVWTTFSADQIDLNFRSPALLLEMMKVYLFYLKQEAQIIRLDAIAFLWKEPGTSCLHLPQTHEVVKLMRDMIEYIDPAIILITETNVPNKENLSYFGKGDEASMVYQFSLPPLLLHALYTSDTSYLTKWAATLSDIPKGCTFFNFTASHDGIGVRPLEGLLPAEEISELAEAMKSFGGRINTKRNSDGTDSPYEMNITYLDALKYTRKGNDSLQFDRFICSQTLMMSFKGIPAFYVHSLLGTHNFQQGVADTGMARSINRRKWNTEDLFPLLENQSEHQRTLEALSGRIEIRKSIPEFHPDSPQLVLKNTGPLFVMFRGEEREFLVLANFSREVQDIDLESFGIDNQNFTDYISGKQFVGGNLNLQAYQVIWVPLK